MSKGTDAIKGDFRVSSDNVYVARSLVGRRHCHPSHGWYGAVTCRGVVMHSSPVEFYESLDCVGKVVENSTVSELTQCHMALSNYTFISVPEMLAAAEGKAIVMLCVKRSQDMYARRCRCMSIVAPTPPSHSLSFSLCLT
jgi:hypothetical protein